MVRTKLNIGCRYSTPVRERPLHPTRGHFTPEPSQTQAPVTPATEPERRAGGSLTTIMYVAAVDPLNAHWAAPVLAPTQPLDKASIPPSTAPSRLPCHPIKSAVPSPHFGVHQHPRIPGNSIAKCTICAKPEQEYRFESLRNRHAQPCDR